MLGFVTTAVLYPRIFNTEEVGLLRILVSYAVLFSQFAGLGINTVTVKLFPYFRNYDKKHHGYLGIALMISLAGLIIAISAFIALKSYILKSEGAENDLFAQYFYYVIPLIVFSLLFTVFDTYYRVLYKAVKGIIYKEVVQRVFILLVIIAFYFNLVDFHTMIIAYCLAIISPAILLFLSLIYNRQLSVIPDINFIDKKLGKQMLNVGFWGIVASFSGVLVLNIDVIMVERMLGLSAAGIYTITFFFGTLILVPLRTLGKIGSVVIADAWKRNDIETISDIYKKSGLSLTVISLLLFIGIWGNIDNIFSLIKDDYLPGKMVIFYIGIANLFDNALSVSPHIIVNSRYYRYLSYMLMGFAVLLIVSNIIMIPTLGIVGAAIASLISKFIFNLVKFVFLYSKFKLQPFSLKYIYLIFIGLLSYFVSTLIPFNANFIIDIIIRSSVITLVYALPVYFFKISPDLNNKFDELKKSLLVRNKS